MNLDEFMAYCLSKPKTTASFPFDEKVLVFKVSGKIFALANIEPFESINLKCDPEKAIELREIHACIQPGFHMNKKHWNTIYLDGCVDHKTVISLIDHSFDMVVKSMSKSLQKSIYA